MNPFFEKVEKNVKDIPIWDDELYLQTHRGTYTTQCEVKKLNRQIETLLHNYELLSVIGRKFGVDIDAEDFELLWRPLLLHQFHDDLPGSSVVEVYDDTLREMRETAKQAGKGIGEVLACIVAEITTTDNSVVIFNPLSFKQNGIVEVLGSELNGIKTAVDVNGKVKPIQKTEKGNYIFNSNDIDPFSFAVYKTETEVVDINSSLKYSDLIFENRFFKMVLNEDGTIQSLFDKVEERETIPKGKSANVMELFQDGPDREAAWNIHDTFERRKYPLNNDAVIEVVETGPVRMVIRVKQSFRKSFIIQDIIMYDEIPRIDFKTDVDWQEQQVLLKAAFPVDILSKKATYEIQFGAIERNYS